MVINWTIVMVFLVAFVLATGIGLALARKLWIQKDQVVSIGNGVNDNEASLAGKALRARRKKRVQP